MKFDYYTKQLLYERLKKKGFVKYLRWYHDEDYLRFRIYDITYKIVVSELYKTFEDLPVFNDGDWVINATKGFSDVEEIIDNIYDLTNWLVDYFNDEEIQKMADYAESKGMSPYDLEYEYIMGEDGFSISHGKEFDELVDELARQYIAHLKLEDNKFGALFQVMRTIASVIFDNLIDRKEREMERGR